MHGLFGSKLNFKRISQEINAKTGRRVYAVDARNHGESPHTTKHNFTLMSNDMSRFMKVHKIPKTNVIGHSMGGRAMMCFVLKYPQLVDKAIIGDVSPVSFPDDVMDYMKKALLATKNLTLDPTLTLPDARREVMEKLEKATASRRIAGLIAVNLRKDHNGGFFWGLNVDGLLNNFRDFHRFLEEIKGLTPSNAQIMFTCGRFSTYVDPKSEPEIKAMFPNAILTWFDTHHLVHFEQPEKFVNAVTEFLDKQ